jgi:hypothetical protein
MVQLCDTARAISALYRRTRVMDMIIGGITITDMGILNGFIVSGWASGKWGYGEIEGKRRR